MWNNKEKTEKQTKLSMKLSKIISLILTVVFVCMIGTAIAISGNAISSAIDGEFREMSESTASKVKHILESAETAAVSIESYLQKAYKLSNEGKRNMRGDLISENKGQKEIYTSSIYGEEISEMSMEVEQYITEVVKQTSKNNPDIVGMGVFFEPYAFDSNIEDYAFYVLETKSEEPIESYGNYKDYSKEEYYMKAYASKKAEFTSPYDDQGIKMVTYCIPIIFEGKLKAIITADINTSNFAKVKPQNINYKTMYTTILNEDGVIIYDTEDEKNVGYSFQDFMSEKNTKIILEKMKGKNAFDITIRREDNTKESSFFNPITVGDTTWWAVNALSTADKNKSRTDTFIILVILSIIAIVFVVGCMFYLSKRMLKPIDAVVYAAKNIAQGKLDIELEAKSNDEIGQLAKAFQLTVNGLKRIIEDMNYILKEMATGNFDIKTQAEEQYIGDFKPLLDSLRQINTNLSETLEKIDTAADQVATAAEQMAKGAGTLAQGSTEQASAAQELLVTINDVAAQVEQNTEGSLVASKKAKEVGEKAKESNEQMNFMTEAMNKISETSKQIVGIINAIEDIASQTNMLSLNAAIESARVGEAGRGFAVVADEIRQLAGESAKAANNTRQLIQTAIIEVENGNQIAKNTAESLKKVTHGIEDIMDIAEDVKESSDNQAEAVGQVNYGIEQISEVIQSNSATAQESSATSEELSAQAAELRMLVKQFILKNHG